MLLIYPPVARTTEPPLGIARLAALLRSHGRPVRCVDLCAEGLERLLRTDTSPLVSLPDDTWTRLALRRRDRGLELLSGPAGYENFSRYRKTVGDLNRGLGAVSAAVAPGTEVSLADYRDAALSPLRRADLLAAADGCERNPFFFFFKERIDAALSEFPTDAVGLSVNFLSQALTAFAVVGYLARAYPDKRIALGGGLVTSWVAQGRLSAADDFGGRVSAVIPGRGEVELLSFLGLERRSETPAPDFSDFDSVRYFAPGPILPYNFSFGCPWLKCSFCPEKAEGGFYQGMRPAVAMKHIRGLVSRRAPILIHFTDNEIGPAYLRALAQTPPGAPWYGFARFSAELTDPAFCRSLAASGCSMLQLGLESGEQAVLDALQKGTRIEDIRRIIGNLKDAGIGIYAYVLFGTPAEDRRSAEATLDFVASRAGEIDFINVAIFNLPTSSELASRLATRAFYDGDLSLYSEFEHPAGWNRDTVRVFLAKEFETEPRIKPILLRNPPVFTSNHAPFFLPGSS